MTEEENRFIEDTIHEWDTAFSDRGVEKKMLSILWLRIKDLEEKE